ncbi:hypothetical protein Lpp22_1422 [Lacticaseibacillus paracasei subsp. paracasei Lpp22]|uniref:Uncharacterized protein n=1 Tax=Lacticaseibacillus paracasei subsp. paracasei Lpp22 TaxID=1256221 RepID=A0A8E0M651_LACPA|nr:hypothetical protein Lpp17_1678 [Lacticaseibacillus paracasei subsp. paracasei Lpp17]EPC25802.1 hypothetical protein Lpp46_1898 [Lacticaseibacillus paracasei subsp. paracasei Lpp46]EPC29692.1 hypothetical protein Lpp22_1422 [Lacticaseibacillus paracasei subsp. paracasei Lpp22]
MHRLILKKAALINKQMIKAALLGKLTTIMIIWLNAWPS